MIIILIKNMKKIIHLQLSIECDNNITMKKNDTKKKNIQKTNVYNF